MDGWGLGSVKGLDLCGVAKVSARDRESEGWGFKFR